MIQTHDVKSALNSGGQCAPGFLFDDICGDESALGEAITVDDVEVRKEGAHLELTEPLRETVGEVPRGEGFILAGVLHAQKPIGSVHLSGVESLSRR